MSSSAADRPKLFIGHTRFSVHTYGSGQFNATRDASQGVGFTEAEYTSWLYDDRRLGPRMEIFTRYSLPQLARASEACHLVHYVSYSPSLPERYKTRLRKAAEDYEFLEINETSGTVSSFPPRKLIGEVVKKFNPASGVYGVYRLDDDDILSVNYFDQMAPYVTPEHRGWWVSLGSGVAAINDGSCHVFARKHYRPKFALGLLYVGGVTDGGEVDPIRVRKHTVVDKYAPTIIDSRDAAFFHLRHEGQDSSLDAKVKPFYAEAYANLRGGDPADLDVVRANFPYLSDVVSVSPGQARRIIPLSGATELEKTEKEFGWDRHGAMVLQVELTDTGVKPQEVRVQLQVESDNGSPVDALECRKFFSAAKIHWSPEDDFYWAWMPSYDTGVGIILPIEPPASVKITGLAISARRGRVIPVASISGYELGPY